MRKEAKKEIVTGISSGIIFLLVYYFGQHFLISLVCALVSFVAIRILMKRFDASDDIQRQDMAFSYTGLDNMDIIKDIKEKANKIKILFEAIYQNNSNQIDDDDKNIQKHLEEFFYLLNKLLKYYESEEIPDKFIQALPMYLSSVYKILNNYQLIINDQVRTKKTQEFKRQFFDFIDTINNAIKKELNDYVDEQMFDSNIEMKQLLAILSSQHSNMLDINDFIDKEGNHYGEK